MKKTTRKVVLIGAGAVGTSFIYSAINQGIANHFGIIDLNKDVAKGHELDIEDAIPTLPNGITVKAGDYKMVKDADVLVITAGRPQKPEETRIDMVKDNAIIMKEIALQVKKTGFKGITIIASNPVDIVTMVYQQVTGFNPNKVISSGTSLDSSRLTVELGKKLKVNPNTISAYVLGEHGDSSVSTLTHAKIAGMDIKPFYEENSLGKEDLEKIHESVWKKAYEIINRKRATYYGIGANLANITRAILNDEKKVIAVGVKLEGQYGFEGFYMGTPSIVGENGIEQVYEFKLSGPEKKQLAKSAKLLKEVTAIALEAIA